MQENPRLVDEKERLEALYAYNILDTVSEEAFDRLVRLASLICDIPIALISLSDLDRQWFKSRIGVDFNESFREGSFCNHTLMQLDTVEIEDASKDERFHDNPMVANPPHIRFYAGHPLRDPSGYALGSLCVLDKRPHKLSAEQRQMLRLLAEEVTSLIVLRSEKEAMDAFFNLAPDPLVVLDEKSGRFVQTNLAWDELTSYTPADGENLRFIEGVHQDDKAEVLEAFSALSQGLVHRPLVIRYRDKSGEYCLLQWKFRKQHNLIYAATRDISEQRKAEEALRISERNYRMVSTLTSDYVYRARIDEGEIVAEWSSENLMAISGYSLEELEAAGGWMNVVLPEDLPLVSQRLMDLMGGEEGMVEYRIRTYKTDEIRWLRDASKPILDEAGNVVGMIGSSKDITTEKEAEVALRKSEERFRAAIESSLDAVFILDAKRNADGEIEDFIISEINENAVLEVGLSRDQLIGNGICELFPFYRDNAYFDKYKEVLETRQPLEMEYMLPSCHNASGWYYQQIVPMSNGVVIYSRDINARKRIEMQLRETNALALVGGWELDLVEGKAYWSEVTREIFEVADSYEPTLHGSLSFYAEGKSRKRISKVVENAIKSGIPYNEELVILTAKGNERWIRTIGTPEIVNGKCTRLYGAIQDIDAQKRTALQLEEKQEELVERNRQLERIIRLSEGQNKRLKEYTYITSHNIRSSVANLIGLTELLKEEPESAEYLEMMETSVEQLDRTIRTMNDLLSFDLEAQSTARSSINLKEALENGCELIQNLLRDTADVEMDVAEDLHVSVILAYLDSLINNLLTNAIKYRKPEQDRADIRIGAKREENSEFIVLSVRDFGMGIDLIKHGHRLFKMNSRLNPLIEGKGLGLFFTKYQVEAMGGTIDLESQPGLETTFNVRLHEAS